MLVWINFYIIIYAYLMLSLHIILTKIIKNNFSGRSTVFAHYYIIKFSKVKFIYYLILINLAGLPPFLLFFIKANFIINIVGSVNFYCSLIIFFCFFLNMLFYTQLYIKKNYIYDEMEFLNYKSEQLQYKILYKIIFLLIMTTFSILFVSDIYFIMTLFFS